MKKLLIIFLLASVFKFKAQVCNALFSYGANFEKVMFYNQSNLANAHYFWDFGDGSGSNSNNPIHEYFGNGIFYVTLYAHDTINNCTAYYSIWLNVTKYSPDPCQPFIDDSFFVYNNQDYIKIIDNTINCQNYGKNYFCLGGNNGSVIDPLDYPSNFISLLLCNNGIISRPAFKSGSWHFNRAKNYTPCSANFEFIVLSEDSTGQKIRFQAMNKNAASFRWIFPGFGDPIIRYSDTATIRFPYPPYNYNYPSVTNVPWMIYLETIDQNGCRDSLIQNIIVKPKAFTYVAVKEYSKNKIQVKLIPNPVKDKLHFEFVNSILEDLKLNISNALGETIYSKNNIDLKEELDVSFLKEGIYYIKLESGNGIKNFKIVKE